MVEGAKADLDDTDLLNGNSALNNVTGNLALPTTGSNGTTISLASEDEAVVTSDGKVTRPINETGDRTVTLVATITKGTITDTKSFTVVVKNITISSSVLSLQEGNYWGNITLIVTGDSFKLPFDIKDVEFGGDLTGLTVNGSGPNTANSIILASVNGKIVYNTGKFSITIKGDSLVGGQDLTVNIDIIQ